MDEKIKKRLRDPEVLIDMLAGAAAALAYTDEEIRDVFDEEEAQEFIDLRNSVKARLRQQEMRSYGEGPEQITPMAAEDGIDYKN